LRYSAEGSKSGAFALGVLLGGEDVPIACTVEGNSAAKPTSPERAVKPNFVCI
jgi:hypothetical protein